jgi:formate hydrogenlyase subunit 3/multisubunit Na+/H+ antiporter MnhD subunit
MISHELLLDVKMAEICRSVYLTMANRIKFTRPGAGQSPRNKSVLQYGQHVREENMKKIRIWTTVSLTLAILGLITLFLSFAALADIYHGEEDVSLEWGVVRLAFFVIFFLIIATFILTGLVFRHFRGREAEKERQIPN